MNVVVFSLQIWARRIRFQDKALDKANNITTVKSRQDSKQMVGIFGKMCYVVKRLDYYKKNFLRQFQNRKP